MTTVLVKIPDKKERIFRNFFKKHRLRVHNIEDENDEDIIAKWIDVGRNSEDLPAEKLYETLRKYGVDC